MNDPCPNCGLIFEREPGYFLGAMYFSYALAVLFLVPLSFLLMAWFPHWPGSLITLTTTLPLLPFLPLVYRYSRVLWIYLDRTAAPGEHSTHSGWVQSQEKKNESTPDKDTH